jgi:Rrf2 family transcriptional regulator, cysteine metabolism repressor
MNISTKSEYGLQALIYPVSANEHWAIPAREIAERWRVPVKYLEQILKSLKEAGVVMSQVGIGGGYRLARPAALNTAGEVIYESCELENACGLKALWAMARAALVGILDQTTLADLCTQADHQRVVSLKSSSGRM